MESIITPGVLDAIQESNPFSTEHTLADGRNAAIAWQMLPNGGLITAPDTRPIPEHFMRIERLTGVSAHGGDGTIREALSAIAGIVPNDPDATENNFLRHEQIVKLIRFFALAGGNGNNWALSAHDLFARYPELLPQAASITQVEHRPLYWQVWNTDGSVALSDIATSAIGFGAPHYAAAALEIAKKRLRNYPEALRVLSEAALVAQVTLHSPAFSMEVTYSGPDGTYRERHDNIISSDLIKSSTYAKRGRTKVNIDDTDWQQVVLQHRDSKAGRWDELVGAGIRLSAGVHALPARDLTDVTMEVRIDGDHPVPFDVDGETKDKHGKRYQLEPGQVLRGKLSRLAIPTAIVRGKQRRMQMA